MGSRIEGPDLPQWSRRDEELVRLSRDLQYQAVAYSTFDLNTGSKPFIATMPNHDLMMRALLCHSSIYARHFPLIVLC